MSIIKRILSCIALYDTDEAYDSDEFMEEEDGKSIVQRIPVKNKEKRKKDFLHRDHGGCIRVYDMSEPEFISPVSIERLLQLKDKTFSEQLLELIDKSGMSDTEVYKKARIDRKHFSKIRSNKTYQPKKMTVLSFAIALELSLIDTEKLLRSAGYSLSNSLETDIIIRYFIKKKKYNLDLLNEVLFCYGREIVAQ